MDNNTVNNSTVIDPSVDLETPDGSEVLQLIYDYSVAQAITSATNLNPLMGRMEDILNMPKGIEIVLFCMATKMGPQWDVPSDQRTIPRKRFAAWCEDIPWMIGNAITALGKAFQNGSMSRRKIDAPPVEVDTGMDPNVDRTQIQTI